MITPSYTIHTNEWVTPMLDGMYQARRRMFKERLDWDVSITDKGWEVDQYDTDAAQYLILSDEQARHKASMRLLPVSSSCMTVEAFPGLFSRDMIEDAATSVEVTRFCVDPWEAGVAVDLFNAGADWLYSHPRLTSFVGVFYPAMLRVYKKAGWMPTVINRQDGLMVGQWAKKDYSSAD